jgi:hypothetical protein
LYRFIYLATVFARVRLLKVELIDTDQVVRCMMRSFLPTVLPVFAVDPLVILIDDDVPGGKRSIRDVFVYFARTGVCFMKPSKT